MDDDTQPPADSRPASRPRLSLTPSWVTLGFVLGALFVYLLPPSFRSEKPPQPPAPAAPVSKPSPPQPERLTEVEAVFAMWGGHAIWDHDRTEIAMWDRSTNTFSDFYEVLRVGGALYFRSIPSLTRPLLVDTTHPESPLRFTESQRMHDEWLRNRSELVPAPFSPPPEPDPGPPTAAPQTTPPPTRAP